LNEPEQNKYDTIERLYWQTLRCQANQDLTAQKYLVEHAGGKNKDGTIMHL
jgi:hypothetical protein